MLFEEQGVGLHIGGEEDDLAEAMFLACNQGKAFLVEEDVGPFVGIGERHDIGVFCAGGLILARLGDCESPGAGKLPEARGASDIDLSFGRRQRWREHRVVLVMKATFNRRASAIR